MKGFRNTTKIRSGFSFPSKAGFTSSTGKTQNISYTRKVPHRKPVMKAEGGRVVDSALTGRSEPSSALDQESGGKTALRPGFTRGGMAAKYANGGQVSKQNKAVRASYATSAIAASSPSSESKTDMKKRMINAQDRIMGTHTPDREYNGVSRFAKGGRIPDHKVQAMIDRKMSKHLATPAPKGHKGLKSC